MYFFDFVEHGLSLSLLQRLPLGFLYPIPSKDVVGVEAHQRIQRCASFAQPFVGSLEWSFKSKG